MTQNPAPRPSLGRALGETAHKIKKLHDRALADQNTDFPTWMLFTLLNEQGPALRLSAVVAELDQRMDLPRSQVISLLERIAPTGDIVFDTAGATVELTAAGADHFKQTYTHARQLTDAALSDIDPDLAEAAITMLLQAGERASALLEA
ncbi:MAG: hypothetical protein JWN03_5820 [Nocardia sp.]|uniref:hypothetical protein n=1 Tax=Nocardia sp. TaxID=1821 RepID=UPI0026307F7A|nr:hypothetical protein [Nocardia sp.]MCU1645545.1 hypothetical protein [Nocardia sp.]